MHTPYEENAKAKNNIVGYYNTLIASGQTHEEAIELVFASYKRFGELVFQNTEDLKAFIDAARIEQEQKKLASQESISPEEKERILETYQMLSQFDSHDSVIEHIFVTGAHKHFNNTDELAAFIAVAVEDPHSKQASPAAPQAKQTLSQPPELAISPEEKERILETYQMLSQFDSHDDVIEHIFVSGAYKYFNNTDELAAFIAAQNNMKP